MRIFAALVVLGRAVIVRMGRMIVALCRIVPMTMRLVAGAVLMMPERHALSRGDGGHSLERDGKSQQRGNQNPDEGSRH